MEHGRYYHENEEINRLLLYLVRVPGTVLYTVYRWGRSSTPHAPNSQHPSHHSSSFTKNKNKSLLWTNNRQ